MRINYSPLFQESEEIRREIHRLEDSLQYFKTKMNESNESMIALLGEDISQNANQAIQSTLEQLEGMISSLNELIAARTRYMVESLEEWERQMNATLPPCNSHTIPRKKSSVPSTKDSSKDDTISTAKEELNVANKNAEKSRAPFTIVDASDNKPSKSPPASPHKRRTTEPPKRKPIKYEPPKRIHYKLVGRVTYMDARNHPPKDLHNES